MENLVHIERVFLQFPITCTYVNILWSLFLSIWNALFHFVTLLYYYFSDHKVVLVLLWDLFVKVLFQI